MGYDFVYCCIDKHESRSYPFVPGPEFDIGDGILPFESAVEIVEAIARLPHMIVCEPNIIRWKDAEHRSLTLYVSSEGVNVDVHAPWKVVLDVYRALVVNWPSLTILDKQAFVFHNESSFKALMRSIGQ